jgi:hypothetical protein
MLAARREVCAHSSPFAKTSLRPNMGILSHRNTSGLPHFFPQRATGEQASKLAWLAPVLSSLFFSELSGTALRVP